MRKIIGVVLAVAIAMPLILSSEIVAAVANWAFDRNIYIEALTSEAVREQILSEETVQTLLQENTANIEGYDVAAMNALLQTLITPEFMENQVADLTNQLFDYLEGKTEILELSLDLTPFKTAIQGPNQDVILLQIAQTLPVCSQEQVENTESIPLCKPAGVDDQTYVASFLKPNLPLLLMLIPSSVPLGEPVDLRSNIKNIPLFWQQFLYLDGTHSALILLGVIAGLFWLLAIVIVGKNWKEKLLWSGWTLILPSLLVLFIGITAGTALSWNMIKFIFQQMNLYDATHLPIIAQDAIQTLSTVFAEYVRNGFLTVGGCCSAIGLGLIAWGVATHPKKE